jgi:hypothetical protein
MNRVVVQMAACLGAALVSTAVLAAQTADAAAVAFPVANVYVTTTNHVYGFTAAANGALKPVPGSPFANISLNSVAANGKYFFGVTTSGNDIDTFSIASTGSLKYERATPISSYGACGGWAYSPLVLDHAGVTLYLGAIAGDQCDSEQYESFHLASGTGELDHLGTSGEMFLSDDPLTISANDEFGYGTDCVDYQGGYLDTFAELKRTSSGLFTYNDSFSAPTPAAKNSTDFYCRTTTIADPANHLAVLLQPVNFNTSSTDGPPQLASYTAAANGNLTTQSTYANMPVASTGGGQLRLSPSGKLLAVGGQGFQIFHFNGSSPITHYSSVLQPAYQFGEFRFFKQLAWDSSNHLYALGGDKLFVYTITPTSIEQAPGSPYTISGAASVVVVVK